MKIDKGFASMSKLQRRQNRVAWWFVLPFVIGLILIYSEVLINSIAFCFSEVSVGMDGYVLNNIGLGNFKKALLEDENFNRNVVSAFSSIATSVPTIVIFSLFVATLLNAEMKGRGFFRALFFLPVIISTGIVTITEGSYASIDFNNMTSVSTGLSNSSVFDISQIVEVLSEIKLSTGLVTFITNTIYNIYNIVNCSGVQIILFLAGLQSISPSVFEAASIEGASGWEQFWKITFPMMGPMILVNTIYTVIERLTASDNAVMAMVSDSGRTSVNDYGLSAAMSWMYFLLTILLLALVAFFGSKAIKKLEGGN